MQHKKRKQFLFIMQHAPHQSLHLQEKLDQLLSTAAFEQPVRLLLLDDGVFLLKKEQQPAAIDSKVIAPIVDSLALFDVNELYVEQESLAERGLTLTDLEHSPIELRRDQIGTLMARHDCIL